MGERKRGKTGKWNVWICSFFRPSYNGTFGTADVLNPQMILQSDKEYKPDSGGKVPCCSTKPSRGLNQTEETTFIQGFIWFFIYFLKDSPPPPPRSRWWHDTLFSFPTTWSEPGGRHYPGKQHAVGGYRVNISDGYLDTLKKTKQPTTTRFNGWKQTK